MYVDEPLRSFTDRLASRAPEPGGGAVAALTGALAAALVSMVSNLTLEKDKYRDVQPEIKTLLDRSEKVRLEMQDLIQRDAEAYGALSEVYRMPRNTEAEKAERTARMQESLTRACEVPFNIGLRSLEVAQMAQRVAEIGNVSALSDAGIAALLARACAEAAALNVKINLKKIQDEDFNKNTWSQIQEVLAQLATLETAVKELTYQRIG